VQTITVSNTGTASATNMSYPAAPAKFTKGGTCSSATLAAGASCTVTFTYSPTDATTDNATYIITGGGATINISLSGTGVAAASPNVSATPASLAFGNITVGQTSAAQTITVSNTGTASATNMSYPAAPPDFVKGGTCSSATLAAGASCTVTFAYSPSAAGPDNPTYPITGSGATINVGLSGTGVAAATPNVSASPTSLAFGNVTVGATSAAQTITVSNTGTANATDMSYPAAPAKFTKGGTCSSATLAAGASCTITFTYSPTSATADNATYAVTGAGATSNISLSGTGVAAGVANLAANPATLSFGSVTVGSTSGSQTITVTNGGGAQATGVSVTSGSAKFAVIANTCGATLNASASCTFGVAYTPNSVGADNASVTIAYAGASSVVVAVSGTGTAAATATLTAAPPLVAFGNVTVGATGGPTTVTVTNTGGAAASSVSFANSNAARFALSANTCGATIGAGASCTLKVAYSPVVAGADSATVTVSYSGGGALAISLTGTGVAGVPPPGSGQLSLPAAVTLPDTALGATSAAQIVTVSNIGGAAVSVTSIASNSGEFGVTSNTCGSVAVGGACTFALAFSPASTGARSALVTVTSNGTGNPQTISVSGNGLSAGGGGGTPPPPTVVAVEYYHANFDHYFITAIADEITKLDNGTFVGWARTGRSFKVYPSAANGLNAVCRFFSTSFAPKSSHFYTPNAPECTVVKANADWQFEAEVFWVTYPAVDGSCPAGLVPVYRVYNNGQGAAPNHRYTTDLQVRSDMLGKGWIPEGAGDVGVIMCAPQ
jgi:hypothetical protein